MSDWDEANESAAYAAALYWACEEGTWCQLRGSTWRCLRAVSGEFSLSTTSVKRNASWRPWVRLVEDSEHPRSTASSCIREVISAPRLDFPRYVSWFLGATTNLAFSAVDEPALDPDNACVAEQVAYEVVEETEEIAAHPSACLTRSELLRAVLTCCVKLDMCLGAPLTSLMRTYVHAATGLEQAVVCHACARRAACYTCTALDATDESLQHRFVEFSPMLIIASLDVLSGQAHEMAAARCSRLFGSGRCCEISRGDARAWAASAPIYSPPVGVGDACALTVVFTSGSTGKPKGLVHGHGGYGSCVARSMSHVFHARAGTDIFLTLATFAWITGQSYMLYGPLLARCTSLLLEGSPLGTDGLRWARAAKARHATILKCASAFVRYAMGDRLRRAAIEALDLPNSSLRLGTFCAEPVSVEVQQWASSQIVATFLNSYWATEHGSIVLSRNPKGSFQPDTRCWPVPWVRASLLQIDDCELGDIVLDAPYAGLARTIFGDLGMYGESHWRGDLERFKAAYFPHSVSQNSFGFVQGDAARAVDGAFTFHGRRDEVINVLGVRLGLEELEKAVWCASDGLLHDLAIVGAPDSLKGQVPVGWVVLSEGFTADGDIPTIWRKALCDSVGMHAEPDAIIAVAALPKTVTGKTQRGLLQAALQGDVALQTVAAARAVRNVDAYQSCYAAAQQWRLRKATPSPMSISEIASYWACMRFDGHNVGGSPLLPATGWLCLLSQTLADSPIGLHKVQILRGVREAHQSLFLRDGLTARVEDSDGVAIVKCEVHDSALRSFDDLDTSSWVEDAAAIIEDLDRVRHYRRCTAVALRYSGPFECIQRVIWRADWGFRAFVSGHSAPALLDGALQVVCSLDALSRGATFVPFYIERFETIPNFEIVRPLFCLIVGELTAREDSRLECNAAFYAVDDFSTATLLGQPSAVRLIATLKGVKFAKIGDSRQPPRSHIRERPKRSHTPTSNLHAIIQPATSHKSQSNDDASLLRNLISLSSDLVGGTVDAHKSLFENGLHSLRAVELIGKINQAYNVTLGAAQLASGDDSFAAIVAALRSALNARNSTDTGISHFAHVDHQALQHIVNARLTGAEALEIRSQRQRSALAEAARGVIYMIRRGFFKYLRIQYRDGLFRFLMNTPTTIDLQRTIVVPGTCVHFEQTDYNRHFTVREIIRDSERGFYNLIHETGLAHLEHYFRVMFFASRLEARFDAELLEGGTYEMRCRVAQITGPLVDAEVAFYSLCEPDAHAFVVTWRLMLVIDSKLKLMYDFERGRAYSSSESAIGVLGKLTDLPLTPTKPPKKAETWTLTRRGKFITSGSIAFFGVLVGLYAMAPVAVRILIPLPLAVADVLQDLKPREAIIIFAVVGFWLRTHPGRKPLDSPVDMLLPHG